MDESDQDIISLPNENIPDTTAIVIGRVLSKAKQKLISFPECWSRGCRPEHRICDCSWSNCRNLCRNRKQCKVHNSKGRSTPSVELCRLPGSSVGVVGMKKLVSKEKTSKLQPESEIYKSP